MWHGRFTRTIHGLLHSVQYLHSERHDALKIRNKARPGAAATSSYTTALHVPHATRAVRLPTCTYSRDLGALTREPYPNIAIHHARSSRGRQSSGICTGPRRTMISHCAPEQSDFTRIDCGLTKHPSTPSTHTTVPIKYICVRHSLHAPAATGKSYKTAEVSNTVIVKTLY